MKKQTLFFDCRQPLLHSAAEYLIQQFYDERQHRFDMRNAVLALPGKRAINRLEEILAEKAEKIDPAWYPPELLTIGSLPEKFYEQRYELAGELTQCFAWLHAVDDLEDKNPDGLRRLLPNPPKRDDLVSRLALGQMFVRLHRELASDLLDFAAAAEICRKIPDLDSEAARWEVLAHLQKKYLAKLDALQLWDKQAARLYAIDQQNQEEHQQFCTRFEQNGTRFFLIGLVDLNREQKAILRKFEKFLTILVFAPEGTKDRFDDFGCLLPDKWQHASIPLNDEQIHVADSVEDQAKTVLRCLSAMNSGGQPYSPSEIAVGVPDKQVVPALEQQFDLIESHVRLVEGKSFRQTSVYRFLETLQKYQETSSFAAAAELLRHPGVEGRIADDLLLQNKSGCLAEMLDRYHTQFLPN